MNYDFVIIGSGLGGLVSGIILAKEGYSVCVLEKNHQAGGNLQTFTRGGHSFSTGLHYIGSMDEGQTLHRFFKYLGITGKLNIRKMNEEGFDRIVFGDEDITYLLPQGWEHFRESLREQFPAEQAAIDSYIGAVRNTINTIPLYNLETAATTKIDIPALGSCTMPFLSGMTGNERLINVLAGANSVYHGEANRTPFYVHSCIRNSFVSSAWKIKGGSGHLTEVLLSTLAAHGGEVMTESEVTGFEMHGNQIGAAVLKDGSRIFGKHFISNLHPAVTLKMAGLESLPRVYRNRIASLKNTAGFFTLYLVFRENFFPYLDYNLFHYAGDQYFNDFQDDKEWPHTFMIYTPVNEDGQSFSRTASVLSFMDQELCRKWMDIPADERGQDYNDFKETRAQRLLAAVERRFHGIRAGIENYYISTPVTFKDFTGSPDGSGYGILKDCHDPVRSIVVPRTKIPNLYLTGQNLNIHGVLGTTISAIVTCSEFIGFRNLVNKIIHA